MGLELTPIGLNLINLTRIGFNLIGLSPNRLNWTGLSPSGLDSLDFGLYLFALSLKLCTPFLQNWNRVRPIIRRSI